MQRCKGAGVSAQNAEAPAKNAAPQTGAGASPDRLHYRHKRGTSQATKPAGIGLVHSAVWRMLQLQWGSAGHFYGPQPLATLLLLQRSPRVCWGTRASRDAATSGGGGVCSGGGGKWAAGSSTSRSCGAPLHAADSSGEAVADLGERCLQLRSTARRPITCSSSSPTAAKAAAGHRISLQGANVNRGAGVTTATARSPHATVRAPSSAQASGFACQGSSGDGATTPNQGTSVA